MLPNHSYFPFSEYECRLLSLRTGQRKNNLHSQRTGLTGCPKIIQTIMKHETKEGLSSKKEVKLSSAVIFCSCWTLHALLLNSSWQIQQVRLSTWRKFSSFNVNNLPNIVRVGSCFPGSWVLGCHAASLLRAYLSTSLLFAFADASCNLVIC